MIRHELDRDGSTHRGSRDEAALRRTASRGRSCTFPNTDSLLRLSARFLIEAHDEWQDSDRRYLSEESMALLNPPAPTVLEPKNMTESEVTKQAALATA